MEQILLAVMPPLVTLVMVGLLVWDISRYFYEAWTGGSFAERIRLTDTRCYFQPSAREYRYVNNRAVRALMYALVLFAISRLLAWTATEVAAYIGGYGPTTPDNFLSRWNHWDTVNYLRIAETWYGFDSIEQTLSIVFFPGYSLLIKGLWYIVGDYALAGYIISNLLFIGSGWIMYMMVADEYDEPTARRADFFLYFAPFSVVFSVTHSESAFLFFTLLAVYLARKHRFVWAIIVGIYAAFVRQFGMLVAIPIFYEMLTTLRNRPRPLKIRWTLVCFVACCAVLLGYGAYMLINWQIYGNPLQFLEYQRTNWGNQLAPIWVSIQTSITQFFIEDSRSWRIGVWGAQILLMLLVPLTMLLTARRAHPADNAYAWTYTTLALSSTWLISGLRYFTALYPIYIALALLTPKPTPKLILAAFTVILFLLITPFYTLNAGVI